jgi:NAD(P)-dependent dehydrogenase (short-subunit alcohol dehydrogenase family)
MSVLNLFDLSDKVAIVTGGGDGLGRVMATALGEAGSAVVICSRKLEKCEATAHEMEKLGVRALAIQCDISCDQDVDRVVSETLRKFQKIDVLVNNAGRTWGASPENIQIEDWQKVVDLNITGTFRCTQKVGREMIKRKSGKIINISSYTGLRGTDPEYMNAIPYNTSKGALIVFTKDLATKWARHNINVNCIAPGWFPTKMSRWILENMDDKIIPRLLIKRFGNDDDLKGVVVFLASRASDYMTGQVLSVDGGLTAW